MDFFKINGCAVDFEIRLFKIDLIVWKYGYVS